MSLFLELMRDGGPIMWVILFCSVVALFIFLNKVFQLCCGATVSSRR